MAITIRMPKLQTVHVKFGSKSFNWWALMISTLENDKKLRDRLQLLTNSSDNFWSFLGNSQRDHGHGFFQYPAMMVPQVVRTILAEACAVHPEISVVGDPFVGSGTVLTETILSGLSFIGNDINPLAVLLCRAKSGPFFSEALEQKISSACTRIDNDLSSFNDVEFKNSIKWFRPDVSVALSKIRRSVLNEEDLWVRRFFWIAMAEAVRLNSNSRTSTFKLHTRLLKDIEIKNFDPIAIFKKALRRNYNHLSDQTNYLTDKGLFQHGEYINDVSVLLGDTRDLPIESCCDIIITSPPYGDNATTVPYGQYSYLPLNWMHLPDIDDSVTSDYLRTTHQIDSRSLGGSKRIGAETVEALSARSPSFSKYIASINKYPKDRINRVTAFFRDLDDCIDPVLLMLRPGGLMVWILGNRKVGNVRVPFDLILSELLAYRRTSVICKLSRNIASKRMAAKNNVSDTMSTETIIVMRKAS